MGYTPPKAPLSLAHGDPLEWATLTQTNLISRLKIQLQSASQIEDFKIAHDSLTANL